MQLSQEGLDLIKNHEGFRDHWYRCPAGVWTCAYGHTEAAGLPKYDSNRVFSIAEGESILRADLRQYEATVRKAVKVDLSDNQYSALVSFCYNVGPGNFLQSSALKAVNAGQFDLVPAKLALWNKGGGKVLKGLVERRAAEGALFASDTHQDRVYASTEVEPSQGKAPIASSTNIAASVGVVAASTAGVREVAGNVTDITTLFGIDPKWVLVALCAAAVAAGLWIIKERIAKSRTEGV